MSSEYQVVAGKESAEFLTRLPFFLSPRVFHKPTAAGTGKALKVELRLNPKWIKTEAGPAYFDKESVRGGGLYLELTPQIGKDASGNAKFAWTDEKKLIRVKLGVPDLSALLVSIRAVRILGHEVPKTHRNKAGDPYTVSLFHKTPTTTTGITYTFVDDKSTLYVSRSKDHAHSIQLTLAEELVLQRYLELALDAYLQTGKR